MSRTLLMPADAPLFRRYLIRLWLFLLIGITAVYSAHAQHVPPPAPDTQSAGPALASDLTAEWTREQIAELDRRIEEVESGKPEQAAAFFDITAAEIQKRIRLLRNTRSLYQRILTALEQIEAQQQEITELEEQVSHLNRSGLTEAPPYSIHYYDTLLDRLTASRQELENIRDSLQLAAATLDAARERAEEARRIWRRTREQIQTEVSGNMNRTAEWELLLAQLEREWAEALFAFERVHLEKLRNMERIEEQQVRRYEIPLDWVRNHLRFDEADLNARLNTLRIEKTAIEDRLGQMAGEAEQKRQEWRTTLSGAAPPVHDAMIKAREAWQQTYQTMQEQLEERLQLIGYKENIWQYRYNLLLDGEEPETLVRWQEAAQAHIEESNRQIHLQQQYLSSLQLQISTLEKQIAGEDADAPLRRALRTHMNALLALQQSRFDYIEALSETVLLDRKFLDEITLQHDRLSMLDFLSWAWGVIRSSWDFEIWVIDEQPLTVRKLVVGILVFLIGMVLARYMIRIFHSRILPERLTKTGTGAALEKIFTYTAYTLVALFVLRIVNIPLEAFAFLGGALAIGFGLGAQNLFNNFLSWFIVMAERTISIGDLVEVEGVVGIVEDIGARRTRIRTGENIDILVPNSSFLEKNVTNWTMIDHRIRTHVSVGVAYGTDPSLVEQILTEAAGAIHRILKFPQPFVLFGSFGDNALVFEIHFWIYVEKIIERRLVQSRLRFEIARRFREAGITIAFPQRDVHLDAAHPVPVRLLQEEPDDRKPVPTKEYRES